MFSEKHVIQTHDDHPVERRRGERLAPGRLALGDLRPRAVVADDGRGVGGQLEVALARHADGVAVLDLGAHAAVGHGAHEDVGHDAGRVALGEGVGPFTIGLEGNDKVIRIG